MSTARLIPLFLAVIGCIPASAQSAFSGVGRGKDGDSLLVGEREVRLFGIDAPEWDQTCKKAGQDWACGQEAAAELQKLVTGKDVSCVPVNTDEHGRAVSRCTVDGVDVNQAMVASGYATAYRHYSNDYVGAEAQAKASKLGIWAGTFQLPSDYRHTGDPRDRVSTRQRTSVTSGSCKVKGNRGSNGWIYHVPGMPYYEQTKAEETFCSEAQAQAAGYRRARVQ